MLYQLAEHGNFGDTFIDRGEELFLARHGVEATAECSFAQVSVLLGAQIMNRMPRLVRVFVVFLCDTGA